MKLFKDFFAKRKNIQIKKTTVNKMNEIIASLDEDVKNIEEAFNLISQKYNDNTLPIVINNFLFFRINFKDIVIVTKMMLIESNEQEKNLLTRSLALHLYEFLDDTKDFLGPKMVENLKGFPNSDFHIKELYKLKEYCKAIKNNISNQLANIRHNVIAHKTQNSIELNKMIKEVNQSDVEIFGMFVWLLFSLIIHFHKNIIVSIKEFNNDKDVKSDTLEKNDIEKTNKQSFIPVENIFNKFIYLLHGVSLEYAEAFSKLSLEERNKLYELLKQLEARINSK